MSMTPEAPEYIGVRPFTSTTLDHRLAAHYMRTVSDTAHLIDAVHYAVWMLDGAGIPSIVVGGLAIQESGYARYAPMVELVVPDVEQAKRQLDFWFFSKVLFLHSGGGRYGNGPLRLPMPTKCYGNPVIADLPTLLSLLLSAYMAEPGARAQEREDAIHLILGNKLPRDYRVAEPVRQRYVELWDNLQAEAIRDGDAG